MVAQRPAGPHWAGPGQQAGRAGVLRREGEGRQPRLPGFFPLELVGHRCWAGTWPCCSHVDCLGPAGSGTTRECTCHPQSGGAPPARWSQLLRSSRQHRDTPQQAGAHALRACPAGRLASPATLPLGCLLVCRMILPAFGSAPSSPCQQWPLDRPSPPPGSQDTQDALPLCPRLRMHTAFRFHPHCATCHVGITCWWMCPPPGSPCSLGGRRPGLAGSVGPDGPSKRSPHPVPPCPASRWPAGRKCLPPHSVF